MRECQVKLGMDIDEVDGAWASSGQYAEVVAFGKKWIECSQRVRIRFGVIATGNIDLRAEARFQRYGRKPIASLGRDGPGTDVFRSKGTELRECLVVKVPTWLFGRDRPRNSCAFVR